MAELYKRMGFTENPFTKFSAEEEAEYLSKIYHNPKYFSGLLDEVKNNNTRVIFGERGSGKSALMIAIRDALQLDEEARKLNLIVNIDDYSFLVSKGNHINKKWIIFLIQNLLKTTIPTLLAQNKSLNELDKIDQEKLSFCVLNFYQTISKTEFENFQITHNLYNEAINPALNSLLSTGVALTSDFVSKSLGLPNVDKETFYRNYLPKIDVTKPINSNDLEESQCLQIFGELVNICHKLGFKTLTLFMDKIDEDSQIGGKIKEEADLLLPILLNTKILLDNNFGLIFFLWSKVKDELNKKHVRFDKIKSIDVTWTQTDLREIMEKRAKYFSKGIISFERLFQKSEHLDAVIYLSNGSPRDLLRLMSNIYDEEDSLPSSIGLFSDSSVSQGILKFLSNYDFRSLYPSQREGSRHQDITSIIAKLKKIGKTTFRSKDLISTFKISQPSAANYTKIMKNFGVIKEDKETVGQEKQYSITDPKIEYIVNYQL